MGQSSNDVIPTAMHVAALEAIEQSLIPALRKLQLALEAKAKEFDSIVKIGRTHLQDATPVRLGQEFGGYARQVELGIRRLEKLRDTLGNCLWAEPRSAPASTRDPAFPPAAIQHLSKITDCSSRKRRTTLRHRAAKDAIVEASGALKTIAVSLTKIANDIRWLGSGPRCGIGEIILPETQPGSSIMPGKVNPVIAESVLMVAAQVIGNDTAITIGGQSGVFELNVMMPVMAHNLLESIRLLAVVGEQLHRQMHLRNCRRCGACNEMVEKSLAMCTALAPEIGYDQAAAIAKESYKTGKTVREIALEKKILPAERLNEILDPMRMTMPGIAAKGE